MRTTGAVMAAAAVLLVLGGCGGDNGDDQATGQATTARPAPKPSSSVSLVAIPVSGFRFNKKRLTARPGTVAITLLNRDDLPHNVRIQPGADCCFKPGSRDIGGTTTVSAGQSITGTAPVQPGLYTFYCSIAGHWQGGMLGTLVVK